MPRGERSLLVGRATELQSLDDLLARASLGRLQVCLIKGQAGIGKSRLLQTALEAAEERGFTVLLAHFDELDRHRPFGALAGALSTLGHAEDVLDELTAARTDDSRSAAHHRVVDAFAGMVEGESMRRPIALALDDLQWADPLSLLAVRSLARRVAYLPVAILAAARPVPTGPPLERLQSTLEAEADCVILTLPPLDEAAVRALVVDILRADPSAALMESVRGGGGNPLFVGELLKVLHQEGEIEVRHGEARLRRAVIPAAFGDTILRRIGFLSDEHRELLRMAAILGTEFSPQHLSAFVRRPMVELAALLRDAARVDLLQDHTHGLRFRHDLIREALYSDMPEAVRSQLHLEAAQALRAAGVPLSVVARHYAVGASVGDVEAVAALREAVREPGIAPETRVELLRRALELASAQDPERDELTAELADALVWAGDVGPAIDLARSLLARQLTSELRTRVRTALARALWVDGAWADLLEVSDGWLRDSEIGDEERGVLLAQRALALIFTTWSAEQAAREAEEALQIGERLNCDRVVVTALEALVHVRVHEPNVDATLPLAQRAVDIVEANPAPELQRLHPHTFLGLALAVARRPDEAERTLRYGMRLRERVGTVWELPLYEALLALINFRRGHWDDAVTAAESCLAAADEVGTRLSVVRALVVLGEICIHRDELATARLHLATADDIETRRGSQFGRPIFLRVQLAIAERDVVRIAAQIQRALELERVDAVIAERLLPELIPLLVESGDVAAADELLRRHEQFSAGGTDHELAAFIRAGRAAIDDDPDQYVAAVDTLRRLELWQALIAAEHAGACLARHGRTAQARTMFSEALTGYEALRARRLIARTLATMRAVGLPAGKRGARARPKSGWDALTDAERRVAALATEGLTNPQMAERLFVSRHTISTHMKNIFRKLEMSGRAELAAEVARRSIQEDHGFSGSVRKPDGVW